MEDYQIEMYNYKLYLNRDYGRFLISDRVVVIIVTFWKSIVKYIVGDVVFTISCKDIVS